MNSSFKLESVNKNDYNNYLFIYIYEATDQFNNVNEVLNQQFLVT